MLHEGEVVVETRVVPKERVRLDKETVTEERAVSEEVRKEQIKAEGGRWPWPTGPVAPAAEPAPSCCARRWDRARAAGQLKGSRRNERPARCGSLERLLRQWAAWGSNPEPRD